MVEIVVEIILFLMVALIVGFGFGFLIAKLLKGERRERETVQLEKGSVDEDCEMLLETKDETIEKLIRQLSLEEDKYRGLKKEHEEEVTAFLVERMDITQKYRKLLSKIKGN